MLGHIEEFNRFRLLLQQALSIQVASGVDDLVSLKMDMVLASLFFPQGRLGKRTRISVETPRQNRSLDQRW